MFTLQTSIRYNVVTYCTNTIHILQSVMVNKDNSINTKMTINRNGIFNNWK